MLPAEYLEKALDAEERARSITDPEQMAGRSLRLPRTGPVPAADQGWCRIHRRINRPTGLNRKDCENFGRNLLREVASSLVL
jgi:hypothetical protein